MLVKISQTIISFSERKLVLSFRNQFLSLQIYVMAAQYFFNGEFFNITVEFTSSLHINYTTLSIQIHGSFRIEWKLSYSNRISTNFHLNQMQTTTALATYHYYKRNDISLPYSIVTSCKCENTGKRYYRPLIQRGAS